jgi:hypothetical protein
VRGIASKACGIIYASRLKLTLERAEIFVSGFSFDVNLPQAVRFIPRHAAVSRRLSAGLIGLVPLVLCGRHYSKICPCVVQTVAVDMVNLQARLGVREMRVHVHQRAV